MFTIPLSALGIHHSLSILIFCFFFSISSIKRTEVVGNYTDSTHKNMSILRPKVWPGCWYTGSKEKTVQAERDQDITEASSTMVGYLNREVTLCCGHSQDQKHFSLPSGPITVPCTTLGDLAKRRDGAREEGRMPCSTDESRDGLCLCWAERATLST